MLKNDEVDYCTKCTIKPIAKEHMCEECYTEHCQWLRNQPQGIRIGDYLAKNHKFSKEDLEKVVESDQWYTLYESEVKRDESNGRDKRF